MQPSTIVKFNHISTAFVWDSFGSILAGELQKLQNRAARVLTPSRYDTNADYLFERLGWKKLSSQRWITKARRVYKSLNGLAPDYLSNMFFYRSTITNYTYYYRNYILPNKIPSVTT